MAAFTAVATEVAWAAGNAGNLTNCFNSNVAEVVDSLDTTDFSTLGEKHFLPGLSSATASFSCHMDDTVVLPVLRVISELVITWDTGITTTADAFVTSRSVGAPVDGKPTVEIAVQLTGDVTHAIA